MNWISKNLKLITIIIFFLFCIKSFQSCNRKVSLRIQEKKLTQHCDSIVNQKNKEIDSLKKENFSKDFMLTDMKYELKISGIKYDEAQKRADAIQKTVSSIRANTTIEIKGAEKTETNKK